MSKYEWKDRIHGKRELYRNGELVATTTEEIGAAETLLWHEVKMADGSTADDLHEVARRLDELNRKG